MKTYYLNTHIHFGKYKGLTIEEIMNINPGYLSWCIENLDHFVLAEEAFSKIKKENNYDIAESIKKLNETKLENSNDNTSKMRSSNDFYKRRTSSEELALGDWNYDPMNPAHDPGENPWIDVFGPGDEA